MSVNPDAAEGRTGIRPSTRAALWRLAGPWWLFLLTGIAWLIIAVMVLRFTPASVNTVGVLMGVLFLLAASMRHGWRWAHVALGPVRGGGDLGVRPPLQRILGPRLGAGPAAHFQGHARHHRRGHDQGRQQLLVARPGGRHPGDRARLLG